MSGASGVLMVRDIDRVIIAGQNRMEAATSGGKCPQRPA